MDAPQNDIQEILQSVRALTKSVGGLETTVTGLQNTVGGLENTMTDIVETVNFIKDHAVTKVELNSTNEGIARLEVRIDHLETNVQGSLDQKFSDVMNHVDAFAKLHETLDQELVSLRGKYDRLEERLVRVEQKMGFATA